MRTRFLRKWRVMQLMDFSLSSSSSFPSPFKKRVRRCEMARRHSGNVRSACVNVRTACIAKDVHSTFCHSWTTTVLQTTSTSPVTAATYSTEQND
mmetsp:Transcript_35271/g.49119  ORF Transcript_35271/g.49119 Transcript_35271/m.49119 type:complete len:95 (+) Transcript_35271:490-774(+)